MIGSSEVHGGNIYKEARLHGINRQDILDFSANINPLGMPESVKNMIISSAKELVDYPDPDCIDLKKSISRYLDIIEDMIIIGNGASEIIYLLFNVLKLRRVLIPAPAFSEYTNAARSCGVQVEYFKLKEEDGFRLDIDRFLAQMNNACDAVMLSNPNNPTSVLESSDSLLRLIQNAAGKCINVIIDEAFIELTAGGNSNSLVRYLSDYDNLFIIRAFTKLFAVPGLRLGYGLGNREIINKMWESKLPWSVNSFACNMGVALSDRGYLERTDLWLRHEKDRLYNDLCTFSGLKVFKPDTNFILAKILDKRYNSVSLKQKLLERGILIRNADNFAALDESYVRFAVKDRRSNERFVAILGEVLKD